MRRRETSGDTGTRGDDGIDISIPCRQNLAQGVVLHCGLISAATRSVAEEPVTIADVPAPVISKHVKSEGADGQSALDACMTIVHLPMPSPIPVSHLKAVPNHKTD